MIVGVPRETGAGETRVALVPAVLPALVQKKIEVVVEPGAGEAAGFPDAAYVQKGARLAPRAEVFGAADLVARVRTAAADAAGWKRDLPLLRRGQAHVGFCEPYAAAALAADFDRTGATLLAMELVPRITRAQGMDALSSMAMLAGYKAAILAADALPKIFPMMVTAAGTVTPARVLVIGAGVAGLQAIATCRRLGAVVRAYDVRPAAREQVESLGARFVEIPVAAADAEEKTGYAKALPEEVLRRQREALAGAVAESDVVITTAAVPGKPAPRLVDEAMVRAMAPGSVIVDLAAERGGNCALTRAGETVVAHGVVILGPENLPARAPHHASLLYAKNIAALLLHVARDGRLVLDEADEITRETLFVRDGRIVHPRVAEALQAKGENIA